MHEHRLARGLALSAVLAAVAACGPTAEQKRIADSTLAAAKAAATTMAGEVMAGRREAQGFLDSAKAAFTAKNPALAASQLREAMAFTRSQADSATGSTKVALTNAADELDRLAGQVSGGAVTSDKTLGSAFGRLQLAEAQVHQDRALAAWRATNPAAAGAELMMVADHFERGLADAGQTASAGAASAIANVRSLASSLTQGATVNPASVDSAFTALGAAVHDASVAVTKVKKD